MPSRTGRPWYHSGALDATGLLGLVVIAVPNIGVLPPSAEPSLRIAGTALVGGYVCVLFARLFLRPRAARPAANASITSPAPEPGRPAIESPPGWQGRSASGSLARSPAAIGSGPASPAAVSPAGVGAAVGAGVGAGLPAGSPASDGDAPVGQSALHARLRAGELRVVAPVLVVVTLVAGFSLVGPRLLGISSDSTAPGAPRNLRAIGTTVQQVDLTWDPVTDQSGVKEYRVVRADNGRQRIAVTNRFYDTMDISADATYRYSVLAIDGAGNASPPSATVTVHTPAFDAAACASDVTAPTRPVNVRATVITATSVTVQWDPASDVGTCGLAGYALWRGGEDTGITIAGMSVTDEGLEPNHSYVYTVVARDNADNDSAMSNELTVTTIARPVLAQNPCEMSAPRNLRVTGKTETTVSLAWDWPVEPCNAEDFLVYRGPTLVGRTSNTSLRVSNLLASTSYVFRVQAFSGEDMRTSPSSNPAVVRTAAPPDTTAPTEPTDLAVTDRTPTSARVDWSASTDLGGSGLKEYRVLIDGTFVGSTTETGYSLSPLPPRTPHTVEVRAVDQAGNASANVPISFTTAQSGPPVVNPPNPDPVVFATAFTVSGSNADHLGDVAIFIEGVEVAYVSSAADGTFQAAIDVDVNGNVSGTGLMLEAGMTYSITAFTPNCVCASPPSIARDFTVTP